MRHWIVLAALLATPALANGPQPHEAEGKVVVKRNRKGAIKSVKIGRVELVSFVVQPNPEGREEAEALAQANLERIAQWEGRVVKVAGKTGYSVGRVMQGRMLPGRPLTNQIQVLDIKSPVALDETVALKVEGQRVIHPELGALSVSGPGAALLQRVGDTIQAKGFVFTHSQEVFLETAKDASPAPAGTDQQPARGTPAQRPKAKTKGLVGSLGG